MNMSRGPYWSTKEREAKERAERKTKAIADLKTMLGLLDLGIPIHISTPTSRRMFRAHLEAAVKELES